MRTKVVRTVHPVGQGAFYSERFYHDQHSPKSSGSFYTVVYDCGAGNGNFMSKDSQWVVDEFVSNLIDTGIKEIDILFISHFHKDHINGIQQLLNGNIHIKNVIMPYVKFDTLNKLMRINAMLSGASGIDVNFADPVSYFESENSDTRFIYVLPGSDDPLWGLAENSEAINYDVRNENISGRCIDLERLQSHATHNELPVCLMRSDDYIVHEDWLYVPFNKRCACDFEEQVEELGDYVNSIECKYENHEWINDRDIIDEIQFKYKGIDANLNETSLLVFSSPADPTRHYPSSIGCNRHCHRWLMHHFIHCNCCCHDILYPSCLYTGDIALTDDVCSNVCKRLNKFEIGALQVPHHGAKTGLLKNSLNKLTCLDVDIFFFSYGIDNRYKHPHKEVLNLLKRYNSRRKSYYAWCGIYGVNELPHTCVEQCACLP